MILVIHPETVLQVQILSVVRPLFYGENVSKRMGPKGSMFSH
jgi:hypothetical protein